MLNFYCTESSGEWKVRWYEAIPTLPRGEVGTPPSVSWSIERYTLSPNFQNFACKLSISISIKARNTTCDKLWLILVSYHLEPCNFMLSWYVVQSTYVTVPSFFIKTNSDCYVQRRFLHRQSSNLYFNFVKMFNFLYQFLKQICCMEPELVMHINIPAVIQ